MVNDELTLQLAVALMVKARGEYGALWLSLWRLVERAEPELAREIRELGFEDNVAAAWVCAPLPGFGDSPAEMVAAGRGAEVLDRIGKTMHGFVG